LEKNGALAVIICVFSDAPSLIIAIIYYLLQCRLFLISVGTKNVGVLFVATWAFWPVLLFSVTVGCLAMPFNGCK